MESEPEWRAFNERRGSVRVPGGESMLEVQVRAVTELSALRRLHEGDTVAVVSHAEWIRSVVMHQAGTNLDLFWQVEIETASVTPVVWA